MSVEKQWISKGCYKHSQVAGLVSVKDYIFLKQDGQKCLLIRFLNEMDYKVHFFSFTLVQLDATGAVIQKTKIMRDSLSFYAGTKYCDKKAILVDEFCTDFRVILQEVRVLRYQYLVHNGQVSVHYIKNEEPLEYGHHTEDTDQGFSVQSKNFGRPRLVRFLVTLSVLMMVLFVLYTSYRTLGLN